MQRSFSLDLVEYSVGDIFTLNLKVVSTFSRTIVVEIIRDDELRRLKKHHIVQNSADLPRMISLSRPVLLAHNSFKVSSQGLLVFRWREELDVLEVTIFGYRRVVQVESEGSAQVQGAG